MAFIRDFYSETNLLVFAYLQKSLFYLFKMNYDAHTALTVAYVRLRNQDQIHAYCRIYMDGLSLSHCYFTNYICTFIPKQFVDPS